MDYSRFLTPFFKKDKEGMFGIAEKQFGLKTKMISLALGIPNESMVPIRRAKFTCSEDIELDIDEDTMMHISAYQSPKGMEDLLKFVKKLHEKFHNPPYLNHPDPEMKFDVLITNGVMGGIHLLIPMFAQKGDVILMGEFTFPGALRNITISGAVPLGVAMDDMGMIPSSLRHVLVNWEEEARQNVSDESVKLNAPKVLYTVSSVQNPTGVTIPLERKKEIYMIAQEYNLMIIEDDSFFYLQCVDSFVPSFQALDTDARVVRLDSMSKVIAPGIRIGWVTGPKGIIRKAMDYQRTDGMQIALIMLFQQWGIEGFERNFKKLQSFYGNRIAVTNMLLNKHLSEHMEWTNPTGGFFFWIKLTKFKDSSFLSDEALSHKYGVTVVPGKKFSCEKDHVGPYMRLGFSYPSIEDLEEGIKRLKKLLEDFALSKEDLTSREIKNV